MWKEEVDGTSSAWSGNGEDQWTEEDESAEAQDLPNPGSVRRRCTDSVWIVVFAATTSGLGASFSSHYARYGNVQRLVAFVDGEGNLCGDDSEDGRTPRGDFLFFCRNSSAGELDLKRPICMDACPNDTESVVERCGDMPQYETEPYKGMLCRPFPSNSTFFAQVREWTDIARGRYEHRLMVHHWQLLVGCALGAVGVSYVALCIMKCCGGLLIKCTIFLLAVVPLVLGGYLTGVAHCLPLLGSALPNPPLDAVLQAEGAVLSLAGVVFTGILFWMRKSVDIATDCVEMACACVLQTYMAFHPLFSVAVLACCSACLIWGLMLVLSCHDTGEQLSNWERAFVLAYIAYWSWTLQTLFGFSECVINYMTVTWCFQGGLQGEGRASLRDVCQAYWVAFRYHLGTCIFGGLVLGFTRPLHLTVGNLVNFCQLQGNVLGMVLRTACGSFAQCWELRFQPLTKAAFADVVMSSRPFLEAARHSHEVNTNMADAVRILNGATIVLQFCCVSFNAFLGAGLAYVVGQAHFPHKHDVGTEMVYLTGTGAFVSALVTLPFVLLFDTVSDAILYCLEVKERRDRSTRAAQAASGQLGSVPCLPCNYRECTGLSTMYELLVGSPRPRGSQRLAGRGSSPA